MSMGQGSGQVEQTAQQKAKLNIANQQIQDWRTRWMPQLTRFSENTDKAMLAGSRERRAATTAAGTDNSVRFDQAQGKALGLASANGAVGSAKQKLGITSMGNDEATATGLGSVAADQAVDDSSINNYKAITSIAKGDKADTINAMGQQAALSGQQATAAAEQSLNERAGYSGLASKIVGTGAGLWMGGGGSAVTPQDLGAANASNDPIGTLNTRRGWT